MYSLKYYGFNNKAILRKTKWKTNTQWKVYASRPKILMKLAEDDMLDEKK